MTEKSMQRDQGELLENCHITKLLDFIYKMGPTKDEVESSAMLTLNSSSGISMVLHSRFPNIARKYGKQLF